MNAEWKPTPHPFCSGQYAVSRKLAERREYVMDAHAQAAPQFQMFTSRKLAQAEADRLNKA